MLSFLGFSVFSIQMRSWALWASKGKLRIMYVFLPVHIFRSFDASFAENIAMLNVYFFIDSPSGLSPVAANLFSEATPAQQSWRYRSMYSLVFPLVPLVVPVFFFPSNFVFPKRIWSKTCSWWLLRPSLSLPMNLMVRMRFHQSCHAQCPHFCQRTQWWHCWWCTRLLEQTKRAVGHRCDGGRWRKQSRAWLAHQNTQNF